MLVQHVPCKFIFFQAEKLKRVWRIAIYIPIIIVSQILLWSPSGFDITWQISTLIKLGYSKLHEMKSVYTNLTSKNNTEGIISLEL
jgi:uncharacterized membrane protein YjdF